MLLIKNQKIDSYTKEQPKNRLINPKENAMPCSCNGHIHGVGIRQQAQFAAFLRAHGAQQDIVPFAALGRGDAATMDLGQTFLAKEVADLGHLDRQHPPSVFVITWMG